MPSPKISIIMPVYNGSRYIAEAIQSVLNQSWQDWELIVVNDGSSDLTSNIVQEFSDPRITLYHQENQGAATARNTGLNIATGKYISFLDADDLLLPSALSNLGTFLDTCQAWDVVYSDGYYCDKDRRPLLRFSEHRSATPTGRILEPIVLSSSVIVAIHCAMSRRSVIEDCQARFDQELAPSEDWDFWIHLARGARFGYLDESTCLYRVHDTNITQASGKDKRKDDLIRGRTKILHSDWFQDLSMPTKEQFLYDLTVNLLSGDTKRQRQVFQSASFLALQRPKQARLLRLAATNYLLQRIEPESTRSYLQKALDVWPRDRRSHFLLLLLKKSYSLCAFAVSTRRFAHIGYSQLRSFGQRKPKPAPAALHSSQNRH